MVWCVLGYFTTLAFPVHAFNSALFVEINEWRTGTHLIELILASTPNAWKLWYRFEPCLFWSCFQLPLQLSTYIYVINSLIDSFIHRLCATSNFHVWKHVMGRYLVTTSRAKCHRQVRAMDAAIRTQPLTCLDKQFGGYMWSDNIWLTCLQPPLPY